MKIKCIHNEIDKKLAHKYNFPKPWITFSGRLSQGKEYVVLGLTFCPKLTTYGGHPSVEIKDDGNSLTAFPIILFEIIDSKPSAYWETRYDAEKGVLSHYPELFYKEFFHDDLSEGQMIFDFQSVCETLEEEASTFSSENILRPKFSK
jgi:hypothetical protein